MSERVRFLARSKGDSLPSFECWTRSSSIRQPIYLATQMLAVVWFPRKTVDRGRLISLTWVKLGFSEGCQIYFFKEFNFFQEEKIKTTLPHLTNTPPPPPRSVGLGFYVPPSPPGVLRAHPPPALPGTGARLSTMLGGTVRPPHIMGAPADTSPPSFSHVSKSEVGMPVKNPRPLCCKCASSQNWISEIL